MIVTYREVIKAMLCLFPNPSTGGWFVWLDSVLWHEEVQRTAPPGSASGYTDGSTWTAVKGMLHIFPCRMSRICWEGRLA